MKFNFVTNRICGVKVTLSGILAKRALVSLTILSKEPIKKGTRVIYASVGGGNHPLHNPKAPRTALSSRFWGIENMAKNANIAALIGTGLLAGMAGITAVLPQALAADVKRIGVSAYVVPPESSAYGSVPLSGYKTASFAERAGTPPADKDGGLKIGFASEVSEDRTAFGNDDRVDEVYIWAEGALGKLEIGKQDGVADQLSFSAPYVTTDVRANDSKLFLPELSPISLRTDVGNGVSSDNLKIIYFTPRIEGFQLGMSYTPEGGPSDADTKLDLSKFEKARLDKQSEIFEVGVSYLQSFEDLSFAVSGVYLTGKNDPQIKINVPGADKVKEWGVGGQIGYGGLSLGGSYRESNIFGLNFGRVSDTVESEAWDLGASYSAGSWKLGAAYLSATSTDLSLLGERQEGDALEVAGGYRFGSRFELNAGVQFWKYQIESTENLELQKSQSTSSNEDNTVIFLETELSF